MSLQTMKPIIDGHSIVVVGFWNRMIFSPEWVKGRLTSAANIGIAVPISNPILPHRLMFEGLSLGIEPARMVIGTESAEDTSLQRMEAVAVKVLQELPHTPVSGVGVNVKFAEEAPDTRLLNIFRLSDGDALADGGCIVNSTDIKRSIRCGEHVLNLTLTLDQNAVVTFDFNFHHAVNTAERCVQALEGRVLTLRDEALRLLRAAYGLEPAL